MGIYAVTGGSKGIGEKTVEILRRNGHRVINIDISGGDIQADLGTREGRAGIIRELHEKCPGGLDGLVSNAGIAGLDRFKPSYVLAVNYFGAVSLMEGVYDLLKMRKGS
jgi:NAD(P)-dependent dehydrogenase (short-subunit alcohol dehydrogenase family)